MYIFFSVLILLVCILLTLIVLVQNSKGGGLASNFSSSSQVMGVRRTNDFLEKATWALAVALLVICIAASMSINRGGPVETRSAMEDQIRNAIDPTEVPEFPTSLPPQGTGGNQETPQE